MSNVKGSVVRQKEKSPQLYFRKAMAETVEIHNDKPVKWKFDLNMIHINSNIFLICIRNTRKFKKKEWDNEEGTQLFLTDMCAVLILGEAIHFFWWGEG